MQIVLYDAVEQCVPTNEYFTIAWVVTGDPAGVVQIWRFRFGELFEVEIYEANSLIDGIVDDPVVVNPAPNYFNYRIRAINSDGVFVDQTVGPIEHFGTCSG